LGWHAVDISGVHATVQALRVRGFARLAATYTLNELADWLATVALALLVYDQTSDALATAALFVAAKFVPALLVPLIVARIDGAPVGRVLGIAYVVEAAALVALAFVAGAFWLPAILALALLDGTLAAVARASTRSATVAILEPHDKLREGNATLNVGFAATNAGAPVIAGVLVGLLSSAFVLGLAAAVFLLLAVIVAPLNVRAAEPDPETAWSQRLREGLDYVRHDATLRTLLLGQSVVLILLTMVTPIEVIYAKESLDTGDAGFGALMTAWGGGMVLGSWLFAREHTRATLSLIGVSTAAMAIGYLGMAVAPGLAVACIASAVGGIGNGVQWVAVVTALQEATEDRFQTRVASLLETVITAAPGVGFLLGGIITALLNPRIAFAVAGVGVLAAMLVGALFVRVDAAPDDVVPEPEAAPEPMAA
jgi:MFS family permease